MAINENEQIGIRITFLDQTGAKAIRAIIAYNVPISRILPSIIRKMNLVTTSPDGQPLYYSIDHKESGRRLIESTALVEAGVRDGDHLIVYPEVFAGGSIEALVEMCSEIEKKYNMLKYQKEFLDEKIDELQLRELKCDLESIYTNIIAGYTDKKDKL